MKISRRSFLASTAGSATLSPLFTRLLCASTHSTPKRSLAGAGPVMVVEADTPLRESLAGYEAALTSYAIPFARASVDQGALPPCRAVIVPGCITLPSQVAERLSGLARAGNLVLLESGAGFASAAEFEAHRIFLRAHFGVVIRAVADLWEGKENRVPYVDFRWPQAAKIRDFSRVVPLATRDEHAIACIGPHVVASKQGHGRGTLLFLGSPLGPALWAGDAEALGWLRAVLAAS